MGQGISTLIPQIVAAELGADWRQVAVEPAPASGHYANEPLAARWAELWMPAMPQLAEETDGLIARRFAEESRFVATADGVSLAAYEAPARAAAASARAMLCMAAAERWGISWEECEVEGGLVKNGKRGLAFGALAAEAVAFDPPDPPPLRPSPYREDPGELADETAPPFPRLDLPAKSDGTYLFAGDVRLPGMVYAAIRHGPMGDSRLKAFDRDAASGIQGLVSIVKAKRWLAAVATDWWSAERALAAMEPSFTYRGGPDTAQADDALSQALRFGKGHRLHERGEPDEQLRGDFALALRYDIAPALHATLETASATAHIAEGRLELWAASQAPEAARKAAARAVGMSLSDVVLYPMPAGGSFDRRLEHDHVVQAAIIAQKVGKPVQLTWSRWQEHVAGPPRTPVSAVMAARTAPTGEVSALKARLAMPASAREFGRRLFAGRHGWEAIADVDGDFDPLAMEGAVPPYDIAHQLVEHVPARIALPTGRLRGNAHGYTCFFTESFIDELAHKFKREPLSYRIAMLGKDRRLVACLQQAATLANWDGGSDASGQGLACHRMQIGGSEGRIAVVATALRDEAGVRVEKLSAVCDIGQIANLDIARQQVEGGLVFGIGLALGCSTGYEGGLPLTGRLGALGLPLLADCPEIEVRFIASDAEPFDPGEIGVVAVAPALASALFSATGLRFRRLPLLSEGL
jgi:isoquinoline 1-oxidoreductase beta subunit